MSLFRDLPPPSSQRGGKVDRSDDDVPARNQPVSKRARHESTEVAVKISALKGGRHEEEEKLSMGASGRGEKGMRQVHFKTTDELSDSQVVGALNKIAMHIGNPSKFSKASKLALQLLEAGSITPLLGDQLFEVLKVAMTQPIIATNPGVGADYRALMIAANEHTQVFSPAQQAQLAVWLLWADVANELQTDDTYQFSRTTGRIRQAIENLPVATPEEDEADAAAAAEREGEGQAASQPVNPATEATVLEETVPGGTVREPAVEAATTADADPFGLNSMSDDPFRLSSFLPKNSKKEERQRRKREEEAEQQKREEDRLRLLRERREALIHCLQAAAEFYKHRWAQTTIDILAKHAFDHISRFTTRQREAIDQLWASVRTQQQRRKLGKGTLGKLDVTAFERLQDQYSKETISIRRGVGDSGGRNTFTWLG